MTDNIKCPDCQSTNWSCWDEFTDEGDGTQRNGYDDGVFRVIGGLTCKDCGRAWFNEEPPFPLPYQYFLGESTTQDCIVCDSPAVQVEKTEDAMTVQRHPVKFGTRYYFACQICGHHWQEVERLKTSDS